MLARAIALSHAALVVWVVVTPWLPLSRPGASSLLLLHALVCAFLLGHWLLDNTTCALTLLEKHIRGVQDDQSFVHRLVSPVYRISDARLRVWVRWATLGLMGVSLWRLSRRHLGQ